MRLLLISNSTNAGEAYLDFPKHEIKKFIGNEIKKILFIPYAAVTFSYNDYEKKVQSRFDELGLIADSIHKYDDKISAVNQAEAIAIGGGNTWKLASMMQELGLVEAIRNRVLAGIPYMGWSAGSNVACPTIKTTNDMPITIPQSFYVMGLIPFQINPHYLDANPVGHAGETREDRITEFMVENPEMYVAGLREGTMLKIENNTMKLIGPRKMRLFRNEMETKEFSANDDLNFLLKNEKIV